MLRKYETQISLQMAEKEDEKQAQAVPLTSSHPCRVGVPDSWALFTSWGFIPSGSAWAVSASAPAMDV